MPVKLFQLSSPTIADDWFDRLSHNKKFEASRARGKTMFHRTALTIAVYSSLTVTGEAHGYLKTPRSKNWAAFDDISK